MSRPALPLSIALAIMLGGCAPSPGAYPSLAPRPIERGEPAEAPPAPPPQSAPLSPEARAAVSAGEQAHAAFLAELAAVRPIIAGAANAAPGGEAWVSAQQALSRVNAKRGGLASALADLDALRREALSRGDSGYYSSIDQEAQRLNRLAAEEDAAIADLSLALP